MFMYCVFEESVYISVLFNFIINLCIFIFLIFDNVYIYDFLIFDNACILIF